MNKTMKKDQGGFMTRIIILIVAIIAIKYYFHFDIVEFVKSDTIQSIIMPIINTVKSIYGWLDRLVSSWLN